MVLPVVLRCKRRAWSTVDVVEVVCYYRNPHIPIIPNTPIM
jgi:hypothetical protein